MTDREKKIAELNKSAERVKLEYLLSQNERLSEENRKLREERDKLIEGLRKYLKELDRRYQKAHQNYDIDSDHHQLGMAEGYDIAENRLREILKEIGVTVDD